LITGITPESPEEGGNFNFRFFYVNPSTPERVRLEQISYFDSPRHRRKRLYSLYEKCNAPRRRR